MLKCNEFVVFTNTLKTYKVVSKKFGDVKKISLFERSEFEIFSRRAFCVLLGRAPAMAMGSGGRFKEGVIPSGTRGPQAATCVPEWVWLPLLRKNIKA